MTDRENIKKNLFQAPLLIDNLEDYSKSKLHQETYGSATNSMHENPFLDKDFIKQQTPSEHRNSEKVYVEEAKVLVHEEEDQTTIHHMISNHDIERRHRSSQSHISANLDENLNTTQLVPNTKQNSAIQFEQSQFTDHSKTENATAVTFKQPYLNNLDFLEEYQVNDLESLEQKKKRMDSNPEPLSHLASKVDQVYFTIIERVMVQIRKEVSKIILDGHINMPDCAPKNLEQIISDRKNVRQSQDSNVTNKIVAKWENSKPPVIPKGSAVTENEIGKRKHSNTTPEIDQEVEIKKNKRLNDVKAEIEFSKQLIENQRDFEDKLISKKSKRQINDAKSDIEFSKQSVENQRDVEDKLIQKESNKISLAPVHLVPINKKAPDDYKKAQECNDLVKKLKREQREREAALAEIKRKQDEKINAEVAERARIQQQKLEEEQYLKEQKRLMIEQKKQERIQARQRSIGDMIERTKAITSAKNRPIEYYFAQKEQTNEEKPTLQKVGGSVEQLNLKPHSLRYEEIIRRNKEELRRKRSLLQIPEDEGVTLSGVENIAPSFKSRLHSDVRIRNKAIKEAQAREFQQKIQLQDRIKNYSKNVKEMYMPRNVSSKTLLNANATDSQPFDDYSNHSQPVIQESGGSLVQMTATSAPHKSLLNSSRPPKPIKVRQPVLNRGSQQKFAGKNSDLEMLDDFSGEQRPELPTFGQNTPLINENFIDKIKAKLDMLDQM